MRLIELICLIDVIFEIVVDILRFDCVYCPYLVIMHVIHMMIKLTLFQLTAATCQ